ncbi:MAG TPA: phosphodiester glycosidase family protein [Chthoniobacterales bacterium]|nr:phosphodiester glycosidase family protein [Chthoniobacterales bacterium]
MAKRNSAAILLVVIATAARAEWVAITSETEPGFLVGLEHRHVVFENADTNARAIVDIAIFSAKSFVPRLIDNPNRQTDLADAMASTNCVTGVNGGYFDEDFAPVGLLIIDARTIARLQHARLLTGVLLGTTRGMQIVRTREFPAQPATHSAVQAGPFLVDLGKPVHGLEATHEARRTFAASGGRRVALGYCSEISLVELAAILSGGLNDFKIQRALNLDGGSSSAFWFKRRNGSVFSIPEQKPVRDFIGIAPR